jgi:hypothetical protein
MWNCSSLLECLQSLIKYETRGVEYYGVHGCGLICGTPFSEILVLLTGSRRDCLRDTFYEIARRNDQAVYES